MVVGPTFTAGHHVAPSIRRDCLALIPVQLEGLIGLGCSEDTTQSRQPSATSRPKGTRGRVRSLTNWSSRWFIILHLVVLQTKHATMYAL